jgi:hypothetical protein
LKANSVAIDNKTKYSFYDATISNRTLPISNLVFAERITVASNRLASMGMHVMADQDFDHSDPSNFSHAKVNVENNEIKSADIHLVSDGGLVNAKFPNFELKELENSISISQKNEKNRKPGNDNVKNKSKSAKIVKKIKQILSL